MASIWLRKAAIFIARDIFIPARVEIDAHDFDISFGFPVITNGYDASFVGGGAIGQTAIVITPTDDRLQVLSVLVHEMVHVITPGDGHGESFTQIARTVGLVGKMESTRAGARLKEQLKNVFDAIGPMPSSFRVPQQSKPLPSYVEKSSGEFVLREIPEIWIPQRKGYRRVRA
jgi:hypothetical protein